MEEQDDQCSRHLTWHLAILTSASITSSSVLTDLGLLRLEDMLTTELNTNNGGASSLMSSEMTRFRQIRISEVVIIFKDVHKLIILLISISKETFMTMISHGQAINSQSTEERI